MRTPTVPRRGTSSTRPVTTAALVLTLLALQLTALVPLGTVLGPRTAAADTTAPTAPANDAFANARPITLADVPDGASSFLVYSDNEDMSNATWGDADLLLPSDCLYSPGYPSIWYVLDTSSSSFNAGQYTFDIFGSEGIVSIEVFGADANGSLSIQTCYAVSPDMPGNAGAAGMTFLSASSRYYIRISTFDNGGTTRLAILSPDISPPVLAPIGNIVTSTLGSSSSGYFTFPVQVSDDSSLIEVFCTSDNAAPLMYFYSYSAHISEIFEAWLSIGTYTVECTARDLEQNTSDPQQFTVTIVDNVAPSVQHLPDITVAAASEGVTQVTFAAVATDNDALASFGCNPPSGSSFPIGVTRVTCTATDPSGNTTTMSFKVTVTDAEPPVLANVPANINGDATTAGGVVITFVPPTASDNVGILGNVSCDHLSGATYPVGTTIVTCTARDLAGNQTSASFTISVTDRNGPDFSGVGSVTAEATGSDGASVSLPLPTATDAVDGARPVICSSTSGASFPIGATTVTCQATDRSGNTSTTGLVVTVVDTIAPTLSPMPAKQTVEATGSAGATVSYTSPTAVDAVSGAVPVVCSTPSGATFPFGTTTVTCSASDAAHNVASGSFTVTVRDTTAPQISAQADIVVPATSTTGAVVTYTTPATSDAVDGIGVATCTPASGTALPIGTTAVTCTARDAAGNASLTLQFDIVVQSSSQQTTSLVAMIHSMPIPAASQSALTAKLDNVAASFSTGKTSAACGQVGAFINKVNSERKQGNLTQAQADELTADAMTVRTAGGC